MAEIVASPAVESFLSKLNGVRRTGSGWQARCPCRNDDDNPSLSIGQGKDGRVLANCHRGSGCDVEQICKSMGIQVMDLYPAAQEQRKLSLVATYDYRDETGALVFQKQRFVDQWGKKTFKQRRPDPENPRKFIYSLEGVDKILYRLPQVIQAKRDGEVIWVVEGEKDADNLVKLGLCATTPPNGAGKWFDIHTKALEGAIVFIVADNDQVGKEHALHVASVLKNAECSVTCFIPPEGYKDVSDLIQAGKSVNDLVDLNDAPEILVEVEKNEEEEVDEKAVDDATNNLLSLAKDVEKVLNRSDLSEETRLSRASMLLAQFNHEDSYDRGKLVNWEEFLNEEVDDSFDWVIPNLIERGERIMIVAAEGVGKTMLARQVAICSAAGINPFTMSRIKPIRTLTIDLENPERIIRRKSTSIMGAAKRYGYADNIEAHILIKPAGVDLMRPSDKALIEETVEKIRPDLLLIGPVYKSFVDPGGRTSEAVAVEVAKYFDMIRDYYDCALWLEHHAPLGSSMATRELRPFGSAVWSRWPEFGLALQPDPTAVGDYVYDVRHFRGARDQRMFPLKMKRGLVFPFEVIEFPKMST